MRIRRLRNRFGGPLFIEVRKLLLRSVRRIRQSCDNRRLALAPTGVNLHESHEFRRVGA